MPHQRIISCGSATHHIVDIHLNEPHGNEAINMRSSRFRSLKFGVRCFEVEIIYQIGGFPTNPSRLKKKWCSSILGYHLPKYRVAHKKCLSCHYPVIRHAYNVWRLTHLTLKIHTPPASKHDGGRGSYRKIPSLKPR